MRAERFLVTLEMTQAGVLCRHMDEISERHLPRPQRRSAKPARLFRGYRRYVVHPEEYKGHDEVVKLYSQILKTR